MMTAGLLIDEEVILTVGAVEVGVEVISGKVRPAKMSSGMRKPGRVGALIAGRAEAGLGG